MGRKKKEPTKVVRVPKKKPDFETIASDHPDVMLEDVYKGFAMGAEYVWNTYISKPKILKSKKKEK